MFKLTDYSFSFLLVTSVAEAFGYFPLWPYFFGKIVECAGQNYLFSINQSFLNWVILMNINYLEGVNLLWVKISGNSEVFL